jgi:hypothetical protein
MIDLNVTFQMLIETPLLILIMAHLYAINRKPRRLWSTAGLR